MKKLILSSNSPRRRELLAGLDLMFSIDTQTSFEEVVEPGTPARQVPLLMCQGKSRGFHRPLAGDEVLITADTVVIVGDTVLGKPRSKEEAREMLRTLSGRTHEVITAVTLRDDSKETSFSVSTKVTFASMLPVEIDYYVDNYEPLDKAGAYGIQEWIGYTCIESIEGSYFNVMGLPVHRLWTELKSFLA